MPRTKAPRKKAVPAKPTNNDLHVLFNYYEDMWQKRRQTLVETLEQFKSSLETHLKQERMSVKRHLRNMTIGELKKGVPDMSTMLSDLTCTTANATKLKNMTLQSSTKKLKRSLSSSVEDEGYLTAGSNSASTTRRSRSAQRAAERQSRSTTRRMNGSQQRAESAAPSASSRYKTPANRGAPPMSYGTITPKIKSNTPQVILRRPKQGEMAVSMQGSPLLVGNVVNENVASVNIPLADGRLFAIQPRAGLRASEVPELDGDVRRQIEALRDNLDKVCALVLRK